MYVIRMILQKEELRVMHSNKDDAIYIAVRLRENGISCCVEDKWGGQIF